MNAYQSARSIPGLPVWTFDPALTGTPAAGHYQINNSNPSLADTIYINATPKGGFDWSGFFGLTPVGSILLLTGSSGKTYAFLMNTPLVESVGVFTTTAGSFVATDAGPLSGDYQLSLMPGPPVIPTLAQVLNASTITPVPDDTYSPITSITTVGGIPTEIS